MATRRQILKKLLFGTAALSGGAVVSTQAVRAQETAKKVALFQNADLRGSFSAVGGGLRPGAADDQSRKLQALLDEASLSNEPVFLPPGDYRVSNINLPENTRLMGIPGATRLIYTGGGHMLSCEGGTHIELTGLVLDGENLVLDAYAPGLLTASNTKHLVMENCVISGSSKIGIALERCGGRIENCHIHGAAGEAGLKSIEATRLEIKGNHVRDCSDGGIYIWRWAPGEDGTLVSGNRVERIGARSGGTGQFGNGINVFRAHNVAIDNNWIADCGFSAIRVNAGNNTRITGNTCLRSGETAIYVEFGFQGAVVTSNMIDGATGGISITNFNDGGRMAVVANNVIRNMKVTGPYVNEIISFGWGISVEADTTVSGNVIEGAPLYGINIGWGINLRNVVVTGNIVREAGEGISVSVVENIGTAMITNNLIEGAKLGAILGHRWKEIVTRDLINGNRGYDHLTIEGNRAV